MTDTADIKEAAKVFAVADYRAQTTDTSAAKKFLPVLDALFFGNKERGIAKLDNNKLPGKNQGILEWIEANPTVKKAFDELDGTGKNQARIYLETRAAENVLHALPNGKAIATAIDRKIKEDYAGGRPNSKFNQNGFNAEQYLNALVDEVVKETPKKVQALALPPQKLTLKGADPKVAAWQEAMNEHAQQHNGKAISVDGVWGRATDALYRSLGENAKAVLNNLKKDGIVLHPERFEVVAPAAGGKPHEKTAGK